MNIRKAKKQEAGIISELLYSMLGQIARDHTASSTDDEAVRVLQTYVASDCSRYSYKNITVAELNKVIAGVMICYEGEHIEAFDQPMISYVREKTGNSTWRPDRETEAGDFYLDSIVVSESYQGKGIGSMLLQSAFQEAESRKLPLTLNVEFENEGARALYEKMDFHVTGTRYISGKPFYYMKRNA